MRILASVIFVVSLLAFTVDAQTTAFSYQGNLLVSGQPANGNFDMTFVLFSSGTSTEELATNSRTNVAVVNGQYSVRLDYGNALFDGSSRFLEVRVRTAGSGSFTVMSPRTEFLSAPYAIRSMETAFAATANNASLLNGLDGNSFARSNDPRLSDARQPLPNSPSYIQNGTTQQTNADFNVSGNGTVGGTLSGNIVNAATQFNLNGSRVLSVNGTDNLFAGIGAGVQTNGLGNSFFGKNAGATNQSGVNNAFFGKESGFANVQGNSNSFFGPGAGRDNETGGFNTYVGAASGLGSVGGQNNSFLGRESGTGNFAGSQNTLLGAYSNVASGSLLNATAVGFRSFVGSNNSLVLGSILNVNECTAPLCASTNVGIGTTTPGFPLDIVGRMRISQLVGDAGGTNSAGIWLLQRTPGAERAFIGMQDDDYVGLYGSSNGGWGLVMNTTTGYVNIPTRIGIGTTSPLARLHVEGEEILSTGASAGFKFRNRNSTLSTEDWVWYASGNIARLFTPTGGDVLKVSPSGIVTIGGLGLIGTTQLCRNASNEISQCSSSIRYKENIRDFRGGLDLIRRLRPVTFNWKADGKEDLGLVAEEVAAAEPLLASTNDKGETEGVKYDRVGVVAINAIVEQQAQIEELRRTVERQNAELEALRKIICAIAQTSVPCTVPKEK